MRSILRWSGIILLMFAAAPTFGQLDMRRDLRDKFEAELKKINNDFEGVFGAEFVDLSDGQRVSINADGVFPTASAIKVPILIELFRQAEQKPGLLRQQRPFAPDERTGRSGMGRLLGPTSSLSLEDVASS